MKTAMFTMVERKGRPDHFRRRQCLPREIEEVLYGHHAVSEASVIGFPDEHWGEVVIAVIVLKPGAQPPRKRSSSFAARTCRVKKPKSVDFWKELPKSRREKS